MVPPGFIVSNDTPNDSLFYFCIFMSILILINVANSAIKLYLFNTKLKHVYWRNFLIDVITIELPIIFYITVYDNILVYFAIIISTIFLFLKLVRNDTSQFVRNSDDQFLSANILDKTSLNLRNDLNDIDVKIIKLGINSFRTSVVIITSIAILAVDFVIFPTKNGKTDCFGFGLMDVGVGYFIMCHSMRIIRNAGQQESSRSISLFQ
jgi:hypothetical protein